MRFPYWLRMLLVALFLISFGAGSAVLIGHLKSSASGSDFCSAGPGEICPSPDFRQELKDLKKLADRQRTLSQDPKVKELIQVMDMQRGMAERMQGEIDQSLKANPGHQWDGQKEKFVPVPAPATPQLSPSNSGNITTKP